MLSIIVSAFFVLDHIFNEMAHIHEQMVESMGIAESDERCTCLLTSGTCPTK